MDGAMIKDSTSKAYQVMNSLFIKDGFYTDGEYIAVAFSNHYGDVGDKFRITLSTGATVKVIMADTKAQHHVENMCISKDGSMIEFIVDVEEVKRLYPKVALHGDFNVMFEGSIVKVERMVR